MLSMTGMGKAGGLVLGVPVRIEIKTVNHRFCDIHFRAPVKYLSLELKVQQVVKKHIKRGRVDIFVNEEKTAELSGVELDALRSYHAYLGGIKEALNIEEPITLQHILMGVGGWITKEIDTDSAFRDFEVILNAALADLVTMKQAEGNELRGSINKSLLTIEKTRDNILQKTGAIKDVLEGRIRQRIAEKQMELKDVDSQRLAMEVVYYLDRMDITEELDRIKSHLVQVRTLINSEASVGRKFDFLLQEFNREFNTIGSKCTEPAVSYAVVEAKAELEKIREQIQNIE
ncbi:MAG: YicC family protein [Deltaproteobacteria bacterium]|nr:YicC family protein [Deltaproteobacteria bacterium]